VTPPIPLSFLLTLTMVEEGTRKSTRPTTATAKRLAPGELAVISLHCQNDATHRGETEPTADEGGEEQLKKKMKALEDKIEKLAGTNMALTDRVRSLQKEKVHHADSDRGTIDSGDDVDSPMFFSARKVQVRLFIRSGMHLTGSNRLQSLGVPTLMQHDQKKIGHKGRIKVSHAYTLTPNSLISCTTGKGALPPQREGLHQPPIATVSDNVNAPEQVDPPAGAHSPIPSSQARNPPMSSSHTTPLQSTSATLPDRPWLTAPLAPGVDPKAPRTANKVYDPVVAGMLTEAQHRFECLLFVEDAYPAIDRQIRWSISCWETVCLDMGRYFELSKEMMTLVRDRRHTLSTWIRVY
jgi:hypothetical protein